MSNVKGNLGLRIADFESRDIELHGYAVIASGNLSEAISDRAGKQFRVVLTSNVVHRTSNLQRNFKL